MLRYYTQSEACDYHIKYDHLFTKRYTIYQNDENKKIGIKIAPSCIMTNSYYLE